jgi:hypothetical protein
MLLLFLQTSINQQVVFSVGAVILIVLATNLLTENSEETVLYQGLVCCLANCFFCAAPLATLVSNFTSQSHPFRRSDMLSTSCNSLSGTCITEPEYRNSALSLDSYELPSQHRVVGLRMSYSGRLRSGINCLRILSYFEKLSCIFYLSKSKIHF